MRALAILASLVLAQGCSSLEDVGKTPTFTPATNTAEVQAMGMPASFSDTPDIVVDRAHRFGAEGVVLCWAIAVLDSRATS